MSLMNDMLRDLEARDARPPVESVHHTATDHRRRWVVTVISGIALLATGLLAAWLIRDVPAVAGPTPGLEPRSENIANRSSLPQRASDGMGAVSDRDQTQIRNPSRTDSAPTAAPVQPVGAIPDRDRTQNENQSPTDSATTAQTTQPVEAISDRDPAHTENESATSIVVRPAGPNRDAAGAALDSARRALARGQTGVSISRLQTLLDAQPDLAEARILLARTLLASGRPRRAEALLGDGLARAPDNHELAFWLARNRLEQNRPEAALETLEAHAPAVDETPDFHLLLGATLRQLERHEQALDTYRRISEFFPGNARAWLGRALSAEALGQINTARTAYRRTLEHGDARTAQLARRRLQALDQAGRQSHERN